MGPDRPQKNGPDVCWFLFWACASSLWCVTAASQLSATFDEPFYVKAGLTGWRSGSHYLLLKAGTMPLPIDVQTLPIFLWEKARGQPFDPLADLHQVLPLARAMNLVFWWALLFYGWRLARLLGGPWAGRVAVVLLACEPSLLAHASLATTDVSVTACLLVLVYHFLLGRGRSWGWRVGVPALCYGLALVAKASALAYGPLCMLAIELHRLAEEGRLQPRGPAGLWQRVKHLWAAGHELRRDGAQIVALAFVAIFFYCGCDWQPQQSFVDWAHDLPAGALRDSLVWTSEHLCVFSNGWEGLVRQIRHNVRGHGAFVLGEWFPRAVWYYFPVVLAIKLTVPTLALLAILLIRRPRSLATSVGACAAILFAFSVNCRVQIGIRLVLPLVALLLLALAVAVARLQPLEWPTRAKRFAALGALAVWLLPVLLSWPNGLSYTNLLWAGTEPDHLVSEANYDWGQGLNELARWEKPHGGAKLQVWYFGTDPIVFEPPFHHLPLHNQPLRSPDDLEPLVRGHYLAVSTTIFAFHRGFTPASSIAVEALARRKPIARTTTFLIYDFTSPSREAASR